MAVGQLQSWAGMEATVVGMDTAKTDAETGTKLEIKKDGPNNGM